MAEHSAFDIIRHASTWSIIWGILLIVFGILAIGAPFLAAVAVSVLIAWLIILAGVVHLILAFHVHRAGSMIWKLLVGLAYLFFGIYLLTHPALAVASLTLVLASLFLIEGILDIILFFQMRSMRGSGWVLGRWNHHALTRAVDLSALALHFSVGDRYVGRREHDNQRCHPCDALIGSP